MNRKISIVLMGTTDFAVPALNVLADAGYDIAAVVCQPDRPNQRGKKIRFLPVKERALALNLPVYQPEKIRDPEAVAYLRDLGADLFVVAAYGQILSQEVLDIPPMGCINIHGSLLPEYRGAAPIHHAIIDGCDETGVTIMKMDAGMDTGDMLSKACVPITDHTTVGELHDELAELGASLLLETISGLMKGRIIPEKQDEGRATYAEKVDRETGKINWTDNRKKILRRINGTTPFPGAFTMLEDLKIKCFEPEAAELSDFEADVLPGTILCADTQKGLIVKCADGAIRIGSLQVPGKKRMKAVDYFRGNSISVGKRLKS